jgi:hypothetical protein
MQKIVILAIICITLLTSCKNLTDSTDVHKAEIKYIFEEIEILYNSYNYGGLDDIMQFYNYDFLHNGLDKSDVRYIWEFERISIYSTIDFSGISINFSDSEMSAIVEYTMTLSSGEEEVVDDIGESAHFSYLAGEWIITGNRVE